VSHNLPLFYKDGIPKQPNELTEPQLTYYSWLKYYDWITSGDGPNVPSHILDDDYAVDDFVRDWKAAIEKKRRENEREQKREKFNSG